MRNIVIGFLIVAALVVGGGLVASAAYQVGLNTAITTVAQNAPDGSIVTPVVPPHGYGYGYGHGWGWGGGPGFGIFGFLIGLFVLFLFFGLIRAAFFRGRGWDGSGWGGRGGQGGPGGWGGPGGRRAMFDEWHRETHERDARTDTMTADEDRPGR